MFRSKGKLSNGTRLKSASLLSLNEINALENTSNWRKNYIIKPKEIGRGHFSKVYHVSCDNRGKSFAAKVIRRRKGGVDRLEKINQEAALIRKLNDLGVESIIQLFETYENFSEVVLISELAKGGSLYKLVQESNMGLDITYVKIVAYKLLLALEAMHKENIVHLDIKADNILLREPYPSPDIALCDFGLATQLKKGKCHKELVGTPDYMAPEVINYEEVSVNTDMWSVGVVVYYLLTGISPFMGQNKDETLFNVSKVNLSFDEIFDQPEYMDAKDFISSTCIRSPERRLSSTTSQCHRWFMDIGAVTLDVPRTPANNNSPMNINYRFDYDGELEDITSLSRIQRCQSVDFHNLDMSSMIRLNKHYRPLLSTSCEDISITEADNKHSRSHRLMNVEEVNDEMMPEACLNNDPGKCSRRDEGEIEVFTDENFPEKENVPDDGGGNENVEYETVITDHLNHSCDNCGDNCPMGFGGTTVTSPNEIIVMETWLGDDVKQIEFSQTPPRHNFDCSDGEDSKHAERSPNNAIENPGIYAQIRSMLPSSCTFC